MSKRLFTIYTGLPKRAYLLALSRFIAATGTFVAPFLVILLSDRYRYDSDTVGMLIALLGASMLAGNLFGGYAVDRLGWKATLIISMTSYSILYALAAFNLGEIAIVIFFLCIAFFFAGIMFVTYTVIASRCSSPDNRADIFSLSYLAFNLGYMVGAALAGLLYYYSVRAMFLLDALLTIVALFVIVKFIQVPVAVPLATTTDQNQPYRKRFSSNWRIILFSFTFILITFSHQQIAFTLPLQLTSSYGEEAPILFGLLMSFAALMVLVETPFLMSLTRNRETVSSLRLGCVFYALAFIFILFSDGAYRYIVFVVLWIAGEVLVMTYGEVHFLASAPLEFQGRASSQFHSISQVSIIGAPLVCGIIISGHSLQAAWLTGIALVVFSMIALVPSRQVTTTLRYEEASESADIGKA